MVQESFLHQSGPKPATKLAKNTAGKLPGVSKGDTRDKVGQSVGEKPKAKERQGTRSDKHPGKLPESKKSGEEDWFGKVARTIQRQGSRQGWPRKNTSGKLPEVFKGDTRDKVGQSVGMFIMAAPCPVPFTTHMRTHFICTSTLIPAKNTIG